ncbi:anthocyanidin 3-O-glucosyltransferase 5-like [Neltuma alba]|uniref:anthocyanidin 3-O-glucosyltransferase 5-like n=1 Tax=Neltuma alba TaxID=207710 RepID=UPI0010A2DAFE|nr:anthocyanidin 3-O-glucosyltransferase 5-like [Prosopis alba]
MARGVTDLQSKKPHIVVLASPGMGHVTPLFEFAKRLVLLHGCHVTFLNITTEASVAQTQLLHSPNLPPGLSVVDFPPVDLSDMVDDDASPLTRLSINVQQNLLSLKSILLEFHKPQAVVIDLFCTQAFEICKELSIPVFMFFTASTYLLAFTLLLPQLDRDVAGEFVDLPAPVQVPGCSPVRTQDLIDLVGNRKSDNYKWFLHHLSRVPMADGVFLNTWEDLEPVPVRAIREHAFYKKILTAPVYPIGPVIKESEPVTETGAECLTWLDEQPEHSVLFIALGSGGTLSAEQLTELAWGLELSGQRFIWVVRAPNDASATATFFNVGGDKNDPRTYLAERFIERTRGRGLVVPSWAPQLSVLRHRSTAAFLSHCGWNSVLESLSHGVPIIAWPLYAEQRMNATTMAEEVGVAVKIVAEETAGKRVVGREEVERAVRMTVEGEKGKEMRRKARELKQSAAKALRNDGSSNGYESLARVVSQWKVNGKI